MTSITKCPDGYALGYSPVDSSHDFDDLRQDTAMIGICGTSSALFKWETAKQRNLHGIAMEAVRNKRISNYKRFT